MIIVMTGGWTGIYTMRILRIHCRDGSKIIWERLGLMDSDEDYHKKALWRMEDSRRQGWRQWRDLIYTFEEDVRGIPETCGKLLRNFYCRG